MDVYNPGNCGVEVRKGEPILELILTIIPHSRTGLGASQKKTRELLAALAGAGSGDALKTTGIPPGSWKGSWLQLPHQNPLCSLSCHLNSSPTGFWGRKHELGFL